MALRAEHREGAFAWLERGLMLVGIACLVWSGVVAARARRYQREEEAVLQRTRTAVPPVSNSAASVPMTPGGLIGSLEIPRVHLAAVVIEGDDEATLRVAIGHLPDTPLPWETGNVAMAGHRDTFFRPLKDVVVGDQMRLITPRGEFDYAVRETMIVDPGDVWVLNPTERPTLTLITCYPFSYIGHAGDRFIVRAERNRAIDPRSDQ
jgi:sortase A